MCAVGYLVCLALAAQAAAPDTCMVSKRDIKIPFQVGHQQSEVKSLILYVSRDRGESWEMAAENKPSATGHFTYTAPADGTYWFTVATVDKQGNVQPPDVYKAPPSLKVVVDTAAKPAAPAADDDLAARVEKLEKRLAVLEAHRKRQKERLRERLDSLEKRLTELEKQEKAKP